MLPRTNRQYLAFNTSQNQSDAISLLRTLLCLSPPDSPDASTANNQQSSAAAATINKSIRRQLKQQTLPAKDEQAISEAEYTERSEIQKDFFDGRTQIELFFCFIPTKLFLMSNNLQALHAVKQLEIGERETIDRTQISKSMLTEYDEIKTLFDDDAAAFEPGCNFDEIASSPQFFQQAPAANNAASDAKKSGWLNWLGLSS